MKKKCNISIHIDSTTKRIWLENCKNIFIYATYLSQVNSVPKMRKEPSWLLLIIITGILMQNRKRYTSYTVCTHKNNLIKKRFWNNIF